MRKLLCCVGALFCMVFLMGMAADATVNVTYEPFPDVGIRLYKVGDMQGGSFAWADDYGDYGLDIEDSGLATVLYSYILRDGKEPFAFGKTDSSGKCSFSGVEDGVYLIGGDDVELDDGVQRIVPSVFEVRGVTAVEVKHEFIPKQPTVSKTVKKVWEKNDSTPIIKADLLKNGELYDSQVLDDVREWTYTWDGLDGDAVWTIVEHEVPEGYTLTVSTEGDVTVLTNRGTYEPVYTPTPTETPKAPVVPDPDEPEPPDEVPPKVNPETGVDSNMIALAWALGLFGIISIVSGVAVTKLKSKL